MQPEQTDPHVQHFNLTYALWRARLLATAERLAALGFHATAQALIAMYDEEATRDARD